MKKFLKYSLFGLGGLIVLVLITVAVIAATFNPNDYKPQIVKMVKEKKQRTLNIEGDIKLAFWPKLGADLGKVSLSEHNGDKEFAAMDGAKIFLAVMPLLRKELVVDTIRVDGVRANIVRYKDGTTNFDDLMSKEESEDIKFDIDGIVVTNAAVNLTDEVTNRHFKLDKVALETGHVAKGEPIDIVAELHVVGDNPKMDANLQLKGKLLADTENKRFLANGLDVALQGKVAKFSKLDLKLAGDLEARPEASEFLVDGLKLTAKANLEGQLFDITLEAPKLVAQKDEVSGKQARLTFIRTQGGDSITTKLTMDDIKGSPRAFQSSGISGEISGRQGARALSGKFSSPFTGNIETLVFDLPKLAGNVDIKDPALPNGAAKVSFNLNTHVDARQEKISVAMNANIDGSNVKGDVAVAGFKQSNVTFNLTADKLDLNKLLGSQKSAKQEKSKPADLSALKSVLAQGSINIGTLLYDKYHVSNLAASIKADGKMLSVNPLSLKVDDSQIKGSVGISQFDKPLYTFNLDIDRVDADRYVAKDSGAEASDKPTDLSALKTLNANGSLRIGSLKYGKIQSSNIKIDLKADGQKLEANPFSAKIDDSQINGRVGIANFNAPVYTFDLDIDRLDANHYITASAPAKDAAPSKGGLDLSLLKSLKADGNLRLGQLKYDKVNISSLRVGLKADGQKLDVAPFEAKVDDSNVNANFSVSRFDAPIYIFNVNVDKLDADRYITKSESKSSGDTPLDLSALKTLTASGEAKLGWLKLANVKTSNVKLTLKAADGQVALSPFAADLYQGTMNGSLNVDARSTPAIIFKQDMKNVAVGPLLIDAINNDMLDGKGTVKIDVKTQGATVGALKKGLNGNAALNLADGAIKGIDIAGSVRELKSKLNVLKQQSNVGADQRKRTEFSEMIATFKINNGVAHNDDLSIKAPLFRITGSGDIDIGNETINYLAKPTVVKSLKGQGGAELDALSGITIPVKVTGTFSDPKYGMDFSAIGVALAKSQLLEKAGGEKGGAVGKLLEGDKAGALEGLLGGKKKDAAPEVTPAPAPAGDASQDVSKPVAPAPAQPAVPAPAPEPKKQLTPEEKAKKKLNKLLGL